MEYFAGLDVSMKETHICVVDRDGWVVLETLATKLPAAIAAALARHHAVGGSRSRRAAWRRHSTTVSNRWDWRWCASRAGKLIRR